MRLFFLCSLAYLSIPQISKAQQDSIVTRDSSSHQLATVIVIAQQNLANKKTKVLSSLDGYLESNHFINMIRRGAYAWEPLLNGMASERSVVTIDGMRIYGACTDKMDPVTSYVEITNLNKVNIHSGQSGSANGATIAGSIDLVRRQSGFTNKGLNGMIFSGLETSNMQKITGTTLQYANNHFFSDIDFTYRDANNYKAGGGGEIQYSQFTKYNISGTAGWKPNEKQDLTASVIYDKATDVGYPALPMDVSLAEALIGSVQYERHGLTSTLQHWVTKLYYNKVTHIMDDTKRPVVAIRMDMPGYTKTGGFYSKLSGATHNHSWMLNVSAHYNTSYAEMTMYANNPAEKDMFMLTWPGVHTLYSGLFMEDKVSLSDQLSAAITIGAGLHHNIIKSDFGLQSLGIFYPGVQPSKTRWLKNFSTELQYDLSGWQYSLGAGYGERAPSVSEGYGFYLFNSFDRFDYIGKPDMKNEKSLELHAACSYKSSRFNFKAQASYFHIFYYIIGKPNREFSPMTIGANGIKVNEQLPAATIINTSIDAGYQLPYHLLLSGKAAYRRGKSGGFNLPLIQPFSYGTTLQYQHQLFIAEVSAEGALRQTKYSPAFGETAAGAYTVLNISASRRFNFQNQKVSFKAGVENLLDEYYNTFADWNRIPRMGRNIFINLLYSF